MTNIKYQMLNIKCQMSKKSHWTLEIGYWKFDIPCASKAGQTLVELLIAIGLSAIILPALAVGFMASRDGRVQEQKRIEAVGVYQETLETIRSIRERGWTTFAINGTYHPVINGNAWIFATGPETMGDFTRQIVVENVERDANGAIVASGGTVDPSTKKVTITVTWTTPNPGSIGGSIYVTRYLDNLTFVHTTQADFNSDTLAQVAVTNTAGGEIQISDNNKAKWCEPEFATSTIDLPDGPPVAVSARANASSNAIPNDVFVATSPFATNSAKMAYVNVTANTDPPTSTLQGTFTLDASKYSDPGLVPSGLGIDNTFRTNDIAYYTSSSNKLYALIATDQPTKEVVAILVNDNAAGNSEFQDPTNKIYKYHTFFNTIPYNSNNTGYQDPSANASDSGGDGNGFDSNPTRAYSNNTSSAVDTNSGTATSTNCTGADKDKHRFYNYNLDVPSGATINGIEVRLDARADSTTGSPFMCVQLSWDGGTSWTSPLSTSTLTTSDVMYTLGGNTNNWGRTWTSGNFSNANFRVRVIDVSSNNSRDFSLDWVGVNVYYSGGTSGSNDQSPFGYGATSLTVSGDRGYVASGGYLYVFDLSTIDNKSASTGLDMIGCRIQLDGFECLPANGLDRKYSEGETGTTWSSTANPAHPDTCADGGNIELYATNDLYPVNVSGSTYIFAAVGAGTNPELNIVNATSVPTDSSSPAVTNSLCGRISGGNAAWRRVGSLDFNTGSGTEEAANSVFARADGNRAYISSNGTSDSKQFYILNTTNKSSPSFLSGTSTGPTTGFYQGSGALGELYPRRSMTVLNGQRVVLVGKDGVTNGNDAEEYQVLNSSNEASPAYCSGINFNEGFNDLTSVIESDLDTYVYMVANTNVNELKIIQGGPDGRYYDSGTAESPTFDAGYSTAFNRYSTNPTTPANTSVSWQFAVADPVAGSCSGVTFNFVGPDGTSSTYYTATESAILLNDDGAGYENPGRCFRYKAYLSTTDMNSTPVIPNIDVNYSP